VIDLLQHIPIFLAQTGEHAPTAAHAAAEHGAHEATGLGGLLDAKGTLPAWSGYLPLLPLLGCILCALCAIFKVKTKLPAILTVALLAVAFVIAFLTYQHTTAAPGAQAAVVHLWDWINFDGTVRTSSWSTTQAVIANFSFYIDPLSCLWMLFVTGLATLIALYASEYMSHDIGPGYCRFFMAFNLFVFSMACLVMGDNLLLLFLGWEGVGLCSYLLIGYFYQKPSAVAAGKKAFIMNRIGDLGLSMGIMLTFVQFGTVEYASHDHVKGVFEQIQQYLALAQEGRLSEIPFLVQLIPVLFTVGAFGKSAQFPLYVWLPDAMEGPTPVSALIHAATMVTAGVYLVARFFPIYLCSEWALPIVAWGGAITALLAATIGMAQFDIKRIMAYSTVSQLGYMFCGLGVMGSVGGVSHVFTHAFFKALLFLACGAVMHGFAGQLDLRKLSGLGKMPGWKVVTWTMLVGCINLAGLPVITAGFWSKDEILGDAFANPKTQAIGVILLLTAGLTAYYTFRVFFRVFMGPKHYEAGDEVHAHDDHGHDAHGHDHAPAAPAADHGHADSHDFHPHPPGIAINLVLALLAIASFAAIPLVSKMFHEPTWAAHLVQSSTAGVTPPHAEHAKVFGFDAHTAMQFISGIVAVLGILVAAWLHWIGRTTAATSRADALLPMLGPIPSLAQHKWYIDEIYDFLIVTPLWWLSHILHLIDKLLIDGIVNLAGMLPRLTGSLVRKQQTGVLHDYAVSMAAGITLVILVVVLFATGAITNPIAATVIGGTH
jgi:NADH-quinone oxidoreductase subunit L